MSWHTANQVVLLPLDKWSSTGSASTSVNNNTNDNNNGGLYTTQPLLQN